MLNGLDLFSGIGGLTIALSPWVRPVAYCEADPQIRGVLFSRMATGDLPVRPIWDDVRTLQRADIGTAPDIVYGGFPCQAYSSAARGRNKACNLRAEFARIVNDSRPRFVFAENTTLEALHGFAELLVRYKTKICATSAAEVGAPFIGKRYWAFAEANGDRESDITIDDEVAIMQTPSEIIWENDTPESIRMDDGLPDRVVRLRALGNAVDPLQAREAFRYLSGIGEP